MSCQKCKSRSLLTDDHTGDTYCSSCGTVQDFDNYHHPLGGATATSTGTFVRVGGIGSGTAYSYTQRKLLESNSVIDDIAYRLELSPTRTLEVKSMVGLVTDGEFGLGNWFPVLVGACCYVVMRKGSVTLGMNDVCDVVGCELYEMGRMVRRVVDHLGLELPGVDLVGLVERMVRGFSGFKGLGEERLGVMVKQGCFLVQCAVKWFLTTGRRPVGVAVAVAVFVGEVNGVRMRVEDVAREVNVGVPTCRARYRELLERLVEVARGGLPWGKDVSVKNVVRNAPFLLKYMEMKSMEEGKGVGKNGGLGSGLGFDMGVVVGECLSRDVGFGYEFDGYGVENGSVYLSEAKEARDGNVVSGSSNSDAMNLKVSHENLAKIYSKFKADVENRRLMNGDEGLRRGEEDFRIFDEWWSGRSELCKRLLLEQILEKDVGLDALPPSYVRGCVAVKKRREKIKAAKLRITSVVCPLNGVSDNEVRCSSLETEPYSGKVLCTSEQKNSRKKRRKQKDDIDWEDFIIETLLLHQVKEQEIEKGHYNALLGVHVFKSGLF